MDSSDDFSSDSEEELKEDELKKFKIEAECKTVVRAKYKGRKIVNGFQPLESLGQGGFATVRKCKFIPNGKFYAMKKMRKGWLRKKREWSRNGGKMVMHTMLDKVMVGVKILQSLAHENIVRMHSVLNDPGVDTLYLVLDYCHRKCVMDWDCDALRFKSRIYSDGPHGGIELSAAASVLTQTLNGIKYMHSKMVVHRDIKPDNLLVTEDWQVKIADFGVSKQLEKKGELFSDTAGTYPFMSPQIASGDRYCPYEADVWAMGITFFALIFSTVPYYHTGHHQLFEMIKSKPIEFPEKLGEELEDLTNKILEKDSKKRESISKLLAHSWLEKQLKAAFNKDGVGMKIERKTNVTKGGDSEDDDDDD
eukprot:CAMPEP_0184483642 /NCGR_PEP_ID=MMETSP0113_2-20130426/5323_1 /TAXON_ID=91329 /ORGANISM="Norrisiella sphaerica, Strain BC52" /LENGTH=363 /DNA_ID=CAMNT_0026864189 /DNA_START=122 /DNA_END=1213 /DNA_ORIENTATION=+